MLDEDSCEVLAAVNACCEGGGFKIVEAGELLRLCPGLDAEGAGRALSLLEENKFIELRYAEEGTYCVRPLPAGRCYAERAAHERLERTHRTRSVFFAALSGALLGGLFSSLLTLVVALLI